MRKFLVLLGLFALVALPSQAGLFSSSKKKDEAPDTPQPARKYVLNVPDKKTEKELLDMLGARQRTTREISVLRELIVEKQGQYRALEQQMDKTFAIKRGVQYYYDRPSRTVYEIVKIGTSEPPAKPSAGAKKTVLPDANKIMVAGASTPSGTNATTVASANSNVTAAVATASEMTTTGTIVSANSASESIPDGDQSEAETHDLGGTTTASTNAGLTLPPGVVKKFFRQFREAKDADQFLALVRLKDRIVSQGEVFQSVVREKEQELKRLNERFSAKFSLNKDGMYYYDPKTMILYEIIQPAPKQGRPSPQSPKTKLKDESVESPVAK